MKCEVMANYYDLVLMRECKTGEMLDMTKERIATINGAFPGTLNEVKKPIKTKG